MSKATLLLADNDEDQLEAYREFLESQGFSVQPAGTLIEATNILERGDIDLAILDLRMVDEDNANDVSGLDLAKQNAPRIPKIILTRYPTPEAARDALRQHLDGLPPAVDFVDKHHGEQVLLSAINRALKFITKYREMSDSLVARILRNHDEARRQAILKSRAGQIIAILGIGVIFLGVYRAFDGNIDIGIISSVAGLIVNAVAALFFREADKANTRMDKYHRELLEIRWLDVLLAACDDMPSMAKQETNRERVIEAAAYVWFGGPGSKTRMRPKLPADKSRE